MFEGPRLKIRRANFHIENLEAVISAFADSDFCRFSIEKNQAGLNILKFENTRPLPDEVPLIIGDAAHNLRSALDLVACEIVSAAGGTPSRWTAFPIRETRQEVEKVIKDGEIKITGERINALILDEIRPYRGGDDCICDLHALDIVDKHRLLITIATLTGLMNVNARVGGASFENCTFTLHDGGVMNILGLPPGDVHFEGHGKPILGVLFGKGQPFEHRVVNIVLRELSQMVSHVVDRFDDAYRAKA